MPIQERSLPRRVTESALAQIVFRALPIVDDHLLDPTARVLWRLVLRATRPGQASYPVTARNLGVFGLANVGVHRRRSAASVCNALLAISVLSFASHFVVA